MENNKKHKTENITDKDIDKFTKKLFEDVELDTPSGNFTKNLIENIKAETEVVPKVSFIKRYKFFIIFALTFSFFFVAAFLTSGKESSSEVTNTIKEKVSEYAIDFGQISEFLNLDFEIGIIHWITILSIIALVSFDKILSVFGKKLSYSKRTA